MRAPAGVAERLRLETRGEHDAIELALDWEARTASAGAYAGWLRRLHAFHGWWEPLVAGLVADPAFFEPRRKLALLAGDLERLSSSSALPRRRPGSSDHARAEVALTSATGTVTGPRPTPGRDAEKGLTLATRAEALGSMYVLEGSTLGGRLIARRVRDVLGFEPAYHDAYGAGTGAMWRAFQARLMADVAPRDADAAVDAARRTFRHLRERLAG